MYILKLLAIIKPHFQVLFQASRYEDMHEKMFCNKWLCGIGRNTAQIGWCKLEVIYLNLVEACGFCTVKFHHRKTKSVV